MPTSAGAQISQHHIAAAPCRPGRRRAPPCATPGRCAAAARPPSLRASTGRGSIYLQQTAFVERPFELQQRRTLRLLDREIGRVVDVEAADIALHVRGVYAGIARVSRQTEIILGYLAKRRVMGRTRAIPTISGEALGDTRSATLSGTGRGVRPRFWHQLRATSPRQRADRAAGPVRR